MLDAFKIEIPCPNCGHKTSKTIAWIKKNREFVCSKCKRSVEVDAKKFLAGFKDAEKALADFGKSLGRFGKR